MTFIDFPKTSFSFALRFRLHVHQSCALAVNLLFIALLDVEHAHFSSGKKYVKHTTTIRPYRSQITAYVLTRCVPMPVASGAKQRPAPLLQNQLRAPILDFIIRFSRSRARPRCYVGGRLSPVRLRECVKPPLYTCLNCFSGA